MDPLYGIIILVVLLFLLLLICRVKSQFTILTEELKELRSENVWNYKTVLAKENVFWSHHMKILTDGLQELRKENAILEREKTSLQDTKNKDEK